MVGSLPFELFDGDASGAKKARTSIKLIKYIKLAKLLRLGRIVRLLKRYARYYGIFLLVFAYMFTIHFVACLWIAVVDPCGSAEGSNFQGGTCGQDNVIRLYSGALHDTLSTMIGATPLEDLAIVRETMGRTMAQDSVAVWLFNALLYNMGFMFTCLFIGHTSLLLASHASTSGAFRHKIDGIKSEMAYYKLPNRLRHKIQRYYDYMWINQKHFGEMGLLKDVRLLRSPLPPSLYPFSTSPTSSHHTLLRHYTNTTAHMLLLLSRLKRSTPFAPKRDMSATLRQEVTLFLYKDVIRKVPFFFNLSDDKFITRICSRLHERIYMPGDVRVGESFLMTESHI